MVDQGIPTQSVPGCPEGCCTKASPMAEKRQTKTRRSGEWLGMQGSYEPYNLMDISFLHLHFFMNFFYIAKLETHSTPFPKADPS